MKHYVHLFFSFSGKGKVNIVSSITHRVNLTFWTLSKNHTFSVVSRVAYLHAFLSGMVGLLAGICWSHCGAFAAFWRRNDICRTNCPLGIGMLGIDWAISYTQSGSPQSRTRKPGMIHNLLFFIYNELSLLLRLVGLCYSFVIFFTSP